MISQLPFGDAELNDDVLSPLIRGGSKAGFYLTVHRDTEAQSFISNTEPTKNKGIDADKQNSQKPTPNHLSSPPFEGDFVLKRTKSSSGGG